MGGLAIRFCMYTFHHRVHTVVLLDAPAGSNLICTSVHQVLSLSLVQGAYKRSLTPMYRGAMRPGRLSLRRKGESRLGIAPGILVGRGAIGHVEMNLTPVGHTRINIDRIFTCSVLSAFLEA